MTPFEDIDNQKQATEELRKSEARFQAVFDNVAVGVPVLSLERRALSLNTTAEQIVGYSLGELQRIDPRSLDVPEDRGMDMDFFQELIEGKQNSYVMERRYRRRDGSVFWARVNYSLVRDLEGKPDYLIGIIEELHQRLIHKDLAYHRLEARSL